MRECICLCSLSGLHRLTLLKVRCACLNEVESNNYGGK